MTEELIRNLMEKHNIELGHGKGIMGGQYWISLKVSPKLGEERQYKITYYKGSSIIRATIYNEGQEDIFAYRSLLVFPLLALQMIAYKEKKKFEINPAYKNRKLLEAFIDYDESGDRREVLLNERKVYEWLQILDIVPNHPAVQEVIQLTPNLLFRTITGETFEIKWHDNRMHSCYKIREFRDGAQLKDVTIEFLKTFLNRLLTQETVVSKVIKKLTSSNDETYSDFEVQVLLSAVKNGMDISSLDEIDPLVSSDTHFMHGDDIYYAEKSYIFTSALKSS
ncbi:hypothetical protein P4679_23710 [Priestia megaterium]|uniref:hypothetical protein n=1 Tax=Priestia megaterium TaxID=1404 RepID=UPI002E2178CC|nr:hypothetical protein [Priestia megaterium]